MMIQKAGFNADIQTFDTAQPKTEIMEETTQVLDMTIQNMDMQSDAPACKECGNITVRSGSCYVCTACGSTTGCS